MLPKSQRFSLRQEPHFFKTAQRLYAPPFAIYFVRSEQLESKATVVVPKKVFKHAVDRNKVRRVVTDGLSPILRTIRYKNIVIVVQKPCQAEDIQKLLIFLGQIRS